MRRRTFISCLGSAAAAWPFLARAEQSKNVPTVGVLWHAGSAEEEDVYLSVLVTAFHDLGYDEGRNIHLDHRFPAENPDRFQTLARELVDEKPDVIIAVTTLGAIDLKKLTSTIPIVFATVGDPVGAGLVESLAHPGGNATGPSLMTVDLSGKRLELLKEVIPNLSRVALLVDPTNPSTGGSTKAHQAAAQALGLSLWPVEIRTSDEVEPAFAKIVQDRADGVALGIGSLLFNLRSQIGAAALSHKLPVVGHIAETVPYGLLLSTDRTSPISFAAQWLTPIKY